MHTVIGPILTRDGGYAFDSWTPEEGLSRGYAYSRIEDAHYARKAEIRSRMRGYGDHMVACSTMDEFTAALAEYQIPLYALISSHRHHSHTINQSA
jgi:hypothetical protein